MWKPVRIRSSQLFEDYTVVIHIHKSCVSDVLERNPYARPLARRAAPRTMQFEHTADEVVGWLKETNMKIQNSFGAA